MRRGIWGQRLRKARHKRRLTTAELGERVGLSPSRISQLEDRGDPPAAEIVERLRLSLGDSLPPPPPPSASGDDWFRRYLNALPLALPPPDYWRHPVRAEWLAENPAQAVGAAMLETTRALKVAFALAVPLDCALGLLTRATRGWSPDEQREWLAEATTLEMAVACLRPLEELRRSGSLRHRPPPAGGD